MSQIRVAPGVAYEAWARFPTGLAGTLGVRVRDGQGADAMARTTTGIVEDIAGSGLYRYAGTSPTGAGQYQVVWDDGAGTYAAEELLVEYNSTGGGSSAQGEYVTVASLKATLDIADAYADDDVAIACYAASQAINDHCGRVFWLGNAGEVRYYSPVDQQHLRIDDLVACTEVATDPTGMGTWEVVWATTDYLLEPLNPLRYDGSYQRPHTAVRAHPRSALWASSMVGDLGYPTWGFPTYYPRTVRITGQWGWPAVPSTIVQAATIMAGRLLKRSRETPYGIAGFGMDGGAARLPQVDPDVARMLRTYARWTL